VRQSLIGVTSCLLLISLRLARTTVKQVRSARKSASDPYGPTGRDRAPTARHGSWWRSWVRPCLPKTATHSPKGDRQVFLGRSVGVAGRPGGESSNGSARSARRPLALAAAEQRFFRPGLGPACDHGDGPRRLIKAGAGSGRVRPVCPRSKLSHETNLLMSSSRRAPNLGGRLTLCFALASCRLAFGFSLWAAGASAMEP
jgi:hypothetical protein